MQGNCKVTYTKIKGDSLYNISGIYKILNVINNKFYIGSSYSLGRRKNSHFRELKNNIHINILLQRSYNKYGEENFKFEILEICNKEECLIREQYYLDTLKPALNISKDAIAPMSGRQQSKETKDKMRIKATGRKLTEETKQKLSKLKTGTISSTKGVSRLDKRKVNYNDVRSLCEEGYTISEISRKLTVSTATIIRIGKLLELKFKKKTTNIKTIDRNKILELLKTGKNRSELIKESGINRQSFYNILHEFNIPIRCK